MERLDLPVEFVGGLRVSRRRRPSRSPRWCSSARSTRTSSCASTATASRRSASAATTACCSASRRWRRPGGEDIGFVGRIERVDAGVIDHIAEDYIPVIASVGADRHGRSHNVNADEAAGAVARALGAYKVDLPHRRRRLAARPVRPGVGDLRDDRRRGRGRAAVAGGRDAAEARRRAWTRSTAASATRTSSTAAQPHSLLLELFTDAGQRHQDPARAL